MVAQHAHERAIDVDQSNDSVVVGDGAVVKLYVRTSPGPQPGLDLPAHLAAQYPLTLDNFYVKYVTASGNWCDDDGCLTTPTYNHMWFVAYLILYTLALVPLLPLLRRIP